VQRLAHPSSFGNPPDSDRSGTALEAGKRLNTADRLRAKGDWSGVKAWEALAAELAPREKRRSNSAQNAPVYLQVLR
jgi:hypothetical protein